MSVGGRSGRRRRAAAFRIGVATVLCAVVLTVPAVPSTAVGACGRSNRLTVCVSAPSGELTGDVPIAVSVSSVGDVKEMIFQWGPATTSTTQLLTDYASPFEFTWRTDQYLDATAFLNVRVKRFNDSVGAPVSLRLTLENGNDTIVPQNPRDWQDVFEPRSFTGDPVIAAVGDGGDGTARADDVAASILASDAATLLYLGDLYERGTPAELDENYGRAAFEPGGGTAWGALAWFTRPTLGNHEAANVGAWRNYWRGRPNWETFVFGGVRFLNLNSECYLIGGCGPGSAQYAFVQSVLASNELDCVIAYWHRPVLSSVEDNTTMRPIWALLADNGGDLVLNGHTHEMEAYAPLNASLEAGKPGSHMVELVAGSGGHYLTGGSNADARAVWRATKVPGALYITAHDGASGSATGLAWQFRDGNGQIVVGTDGQGVGSVDCAAEPDTTAPTVPGRPSGVSNAAGTIDLSWAASTDDRAGVLTYSVYRDGAADAVATVTSSSATTVSFRDAGLAPGSIHTYEVSASDGLKSSERSMPSDPITVSSSPIVFSDDFSSGTFSRWSDTSGLAIDHTSGGTAPPSARAQAAGTRAWAAKNLGSTHSSLCHSMRVNLSSIGANSVALARLRTAADGPVARVYVSASRVLWIRSDVSGAQLSSGRSLPAGWNTLELCAGVGSSGSVRLSLNGSTIAGPWTANLGTTPIGRVQIGDTALFTWTANFDDIVVTSS
ncbi:MAG TPA: metallophosphoesterase [Actinomycetota bacterium]|nr:metallophosphoesterase [Actinomycetota bacterium]